MNKNLLTIEKRSSINGSFWKKRFIDNDINSIFNDYCKKTLTGDPLEVYVDGISEIQKFI